MNTTATIQLLSYYEAMLGFTQEMLDAARKGDWNSVLHAESNRSAVEKVVRHADSATWSGDDMEKKIALLKAILRADEETRTLTKARMTSLQGMIGSVGTEKKLKNAYNQP